jgi:hypothetical protein
METINESLEQYTKEMIGDRVTSNAIQYLASRAVYP